MARKSRQYLEEHLEWARNDLKTIHADYQVRLGEVAAHNERLSSFLDDLLELEPSLDKYRLSNDDPWALSPRAWDIDGVKRAVAFRAEQANADKYTPQHESVRLASNVHLSFAFPTEATSAARDCE